MSAVLPVLTTILHRGYVIRFELNFSHKNFEIFIVTLLVWTGLSFNITLLLEHNYLQ